MKLHDLFSIVIKVFGLFIIKDLFVNLPYLLEPLVAMAGSDARFDTGAVIVTLLVMALYVSIAYALIFKTESIVKLLKLEPQLSDEFLTFNISSKNVLNISLIILAGYVLIDTVPDFCNYLFNYYQQMHDKYLTTSPSISRLLISAVKIVIALLIIGERKWIIELADRKNKINDEEADEPVGGEAYEE